MACGNNRNVVFRSKNDYIYYLESMEKYKTDHPFDLFHYCLMPNHIHLLIKTNKASDFSTFAKEGKFSILSSLQ